MNNWIKLLPETFLPVRAAFKLEDKAAVGNISWLHFAASNGTVIAIKGIKTNDKVEWFTPSAVTMGGLVEEYSPSKEREIFIYPEITETTNLGKEHLAYLISIDPSPGLKDAFETINESQLTGLLAHELSEVIITDRKGGYHYRMGPHDLAHT
ncbi:MAG: hypothetical protein AABX99_00090, partial [Nanoarchaeota archaeon]